MKLSNEFFDDKSDVENINSSKNSKELNIGNSNQISIIEEDKNSISSDKSNNIEFHDNADEDNQRIEREELFGIKFSNEVHNHLPNFFF